MVRVFLLLFNIYFVLLQRFIILKDNLKRLYYLFDKLRFIIFTTIYQKMCFYHMFNITHLDLCLTILLLCKHLQRSYILLLFYPINPAT